MQAQGRPHQIFGINHLQLRLRLRRTRPKRRSTPLFTQIYDLAVRPLVDSAFQGARVTCFAYGQTGSGKTYTMNGNMGQGIRGLYTLGANDIFEYLASVNGKICSPSSDTWRQSCHFTKFTVESCLICWTNATNWNCGRTTKITSTSSASKKPVSPPARNS